MFSKSNLDDDNDCDRSSRTLRCTPTICRKLPSTSDILRSVIFPTLQSRRIRKNLRLIGFLEIKNFQHFFKNELFCSSADSSCASIFQLLLWNTQQMNCDRKTLIFSQPCVRLPFVKTHSEIRLAGGTFTSASHLVLEVLAETSVSDWLAIPVPI